MLYHASRGRLLWGRHRRRARPPRVPPVAGHALSAAPQPRVHRLPPARRPHRRRESAEVLRGHSGWPEGPRGVPAQDRRARRGDHGRRAQRGRRRGRRRRPASGEPSRYGVVSGSDMVTEESTVTNHRWRARAHIVHRRQLDAGADRGADTNPPGPSEVVATTSLADASIAAAAIEAAAKALPSWRARRRHPRCGEALRRAADLLDARAAEIGRDLTREEGKTLPESTARRSWPRRSFGTSPGRRSIPRARPTPRTSPTCCSTPARAARRRDGHHAMELPDRHPGLEDRPGPGVRQHGRVEAGRLGPADGDPPPASADRRRPARGVLNRRPRQGLRGRRRPRDPPRGGRGHLHRVQRRRAGHPGEPPRRARTSSSRWAARTRRSSSPTPTSTWRPSTSPSRLSARPGRSAPPRVASIVERSVCRTGRRS